SEVSDKSVKERNRKTYEDALAWVETHSTSRLNFLVHYANDLPAKHAGVGLARKIGMDEAVRRLERIQIPSDESILVCFDADSTCQPNYLQAIEEHFYRNPETPGCAIHYEHPLRGPYDLAKIGR